MRGWREKNDQEKVYRGRKRPGGFFRFASLVRSVSLTKASRSHPIKDMQKSSVVALIAFAALLVFVALPARCLAAEAVDKPLEAVSNSLDRSDRPQARSCRSTCIKRRVRARA